MGDQQQATVVRVPYGDVPIFIVRMVRVTNCDAEEIAENRRGLAEGHRVLAKILCGFARIPLELHVMF